MNRNSKESSLRKRSTTSRPVDQEGEAPAVRQAQPESCGASSSRVVAVLVPDLGSRFHMLAFRGISDKLVSHGYDVLYHNVRREGEGDPDTMAALRVCRPAGYIILRGAEGLGGAHAQAILKTGGPLVSLGLLDTVETHAVALDNRAVMRMAADYALKLGHRRLGYLAGPSFSMAARHRRAGFKESLASHGVPASDAVILTTGNSAKQEYSAALKMLREPKTRPTAVLCFNDTLAVQVYRAAHELNLEIPRDISVIGVDGVDLAAEWKPPLTTVDIFPEQSGCQAAELLVRAIRGELGETVTVQWIKPRLLERGSARSV